ncbi:MotA/TolQ/ExbB proton channel family protein [Alloalcanivorax xenomutans]|uniref:MotA/TolQ/ExbB proton channel family protein n=1 Tax=Alloalcanivorax xenomutans TaxID=1094342 RepID=UPI0024E20D9D|nr:MotA/TolQ/ExbB proton channel family protein [Alloalcanivorax xenomutans]
MAFFADIETLLYAVSRIFLAPVLALIALALGYALVMLGAFLVETWQRRRGDHTGELFAFARRHDMTPHSDDLELWILHRLEWLRIVSRTAPMLGLIATMIPMGPALLALGNNDAESVGRNMVAAFSAVILALIAASLCFFMLTVRRRWLLQDLRELEKQRQRESEL